MNAEPINPFLNDPGAIAVSSRITAGDAGKLIAVYASLRLRDHVDDLFVAHGGHFIGWLLSTLDAQPIRIVATKTSSGGFDLWSAIVTCSSGLRLSLDLGHGLGAAQLDELEIRAEWSGERSVIAYEPNKVGVTVLTSTGATRASAAVLPLEQALAASPACREPLALEIAAAIRDAALRQTVVVRG